MAAYSNTPIFRWSDKSHEHFISYQHAVRLAMGNSRPSLVLSERSWDFSKVFKSDITGRNIYTFPRFAEIDGRGRVGRSDGLWSDFLRIVVFNEITASATLGLKQRGSTLPATFSTCEILRVQSRRIRSCLWRGHSETHTGTTQILCRSQSYRRWGDQHVEIDWLRWEAMASFDPGYKAA